MILETNFADISVLDKNGRNILFYAIDAQKNISFNSHFESLYNLFDKLILAGADINIIDNNGLSLLEYAKSKRDKDVVKFLSEYTQK